VKPSNQPDYFQNDTSILTLVFGLNLAANSLKLHSQSLGWIKVGDI